MATKLQAPFSNTLSWNIVFAYWFKFSMKCVPGGPIDNHPALVYCTFKSNIVCLITHEVPLCRIHFYNLKSDDTEAIQSYLVLQIIWIKIINLTGRWLLLTTSVSHVHPNRVRISVLIMTLSNGNILRVTGYLCGEFTGPRWIPRTKASNAEL